MATGETPNPDRAFRLAECATDPECFAASKGQLKPGRTGAVTDRAQRPNVHGDRLRFYVACLAR
jgi:hypothetical protein